MIPVCGQSMPIPLKKKKTGIRKQMKKQKPHGNPLQIGLFWEKRFQRWKKAYFQQGKKPNKFHSPPQWACFLELDWFLLALTSKLLCGWFRDTILCPWGLMRVSSLDFFRAGHNGLTWRCVRNVELSCSHLSSSSTLSPAPQLPPPFPFNSSAKTLPTEQK